jgi:hypothetical protein
VNARDLSQLLSKILVEQDGVVHRRQAYEAGVSRSAWRWWISQRHWQKILPAVYLTTSGPASRRQRLIAASLFAGPDAQVTGAAALRLHGVGFVHAAGLVRLLVPHTRQRVGKGFVRLHRTRRLDPRPLMIGPIAVASLPRAVIDAARTFGPDERMVRCLIADVLQRRLCTLAELQAELRAGPRQGSALTREVLRDFS